MTICRSRLIALFAGAIMAPALLMGQARDSSQAREYRVRPGDTLWRIANAMLGDGSRWREIARLNPRTAPNRLRVGMRLVLPGRASATATPRVATKTPTRASTAPQRVANAPRTTIRQAPRQVERAPSRDTIVPPLGTPGPGGRSIFYAPRPGDVPAVIVDSLGSGPLPDSIPPPRAVRPWEYVSAPFLATDEQVANAGSCRRLEGAAGASATSSIVRIADRMALVLPRGARADSGARWLTARRGDEVPGWGRIIVPTGVVRLIPAAAASEARGDVVAQFDAITCNDALVLPMEVPADTTTRRPVHVSGGSPGRVLVVASSALLPSLQHVVITNLGSNAGVKAGDQITLYAITESATRADSTEVAVANVLRVGPRTSSALIVQQTRPAIAVGLPVRVTARLP